MFGSRLVAVLVGLAFVFLFAMMTALVLSILPYVEGATAWMVVTSWAAAAIYLAGLAMSVLGVWRAIGDAKRHREQERKQVQERIARGARAAK